MTHSPDAIRIANCSGFYGDRLSAMRETITGGRIDVLTGDWLAELTMGILHRQRLRDATAGYARTFVTQLEDVLSDCIERGVTIVSNAGGANPAACGAAVQDLAHRLGLKVTIAVVDGDDVTDVIAHRVDTGHPLTHLVTGEDLADRAATPVAANAYLGAWGIVEALDAGADIVITGRVTDASIVAAPAAQRFGWHRSDWDRLAGAVVAGHVIECGAQATGGNLSFFREVEDLSHAGFPIAEISADGSSVVTKHAGTGGAVTIDSVTAQLVYEIDGPSYLNTDVVARLDTVELAQMGRDRVRISGVRGEPAPETVKVGVLADVGWRNSILLGMAGRNIQAKATLAQETIWSTIDGGSDAFDDVHVQVIGSECANPSTMVDATCALTVAVKGRNRTAVDDFGRAVVETGLASYPGLFLLTTPTRASSVTVFWPVELPAGEVQQRVTVGDRTWTVAHESTAIPAAEIPSTPPPPDRITVDGAAVPLGDVFGARSGDKAGNATLGIWARTEAEFAWLDSWWSAASLRSILPEVAGLDIRPWRLPNIRAVGATIVGFLGDGVASNLALDPQAKSLGEYVLAKVVPMPPTFNSEDRHGDNRL